MMKIPPFLNLMWPLLFSTVAFSLPQGEQIVHGQAEIARGPRTFSITTSDKAIINYGSFNIGEKERVEFIQPSSTSTVLNRVVGSDPSSILGNITSNGKVFLVNPNGIYFGAGASVNVGSLIASTLDILDQDFLEDRFYFSAKKGTTPGMIHNLGQITSQEGVIAFISPHIKNEGAITANAGKVIFAAGEAVTLDFTGDGLMKFIIEGEIEDAVVEHLGTIEAKEVFMNVKTAHKAIRDVINTDELIQGNTLVKENGIIRIVHQSKIKADKVFLEGSDKASIEGTIDASSTSFGGRVEILADHITLTGATINASGELGGGEVLVGGDYKGEGTLRNALTNIMDESSTILANALTKGNGGKVILWADETTIFNGSIEA
ncbi:MAG: filamentous hemagglutinin N-terminal domain-containing protein, partial [Verrucomicrobia bacterium]|nr:filamentous hemagglutinin N-terminal domain-containing protein [Verrucomicrobiota bacterium]